MNQKKFHNKYEIRYKISIDEWVEIAYNVAVTKITTRYGIVYQNEEIEVENHVVVIPL